MEKELQGIEEESKVDILLESLRATLKKVRNRKTPGHNDVRGFWFKKFSSIFGRRALQLSRCLEEAWMDKRIILDG